MAGWPLLLRVVRFLIALRSAAEAANVWETVVTWVVREDTTASDPRQRVRTFG
jgi:hypothetical protein